MEEKQERNEFDSFEGEQLQLFSINDIFEEIINTLFDDLERNDYALVKELATEKGLEEAIEKEQKKKEQKKKKTRKKKTTTDSTEDLAAPRRRRPRTDAEVDQLSKTDSSFDSWDTEVNRERVFRRRRPPSDSEFATEEPLGGRRERVFRRRRDIEEERKKQELNAEKKELLETESKEDKQKEILKLAQQMAQSTAEQFINSSVPEKMKEFIGESTLKLQQQELALAMRDILKSQFLWAHQQTLLELKKNITDD